MKKWTNVIFNQIVLMLLIDSFIVVLWKQLEELGEMGNKNMEVN